MRIKLDTGTYVFWQTWILKYILHAITFFTILPPEWPMLDLKIIYTPNYHWTSCERNYLLLRLYSLTEALKRFILFSINLILPITLVLQMQRKMIIRCQPLFSWLLFWLVENSLDMTCKKKNLKSFGKVFCLSKVVSKNAMDINII